MKSTNHQKKFYLDLKNQPQLKPAVVNCIKYMNGKLEEFLNKDAHYVITDRPKMDWPLPVTEKPTKGPTVAESDITSSIASSITPLTGVNIANIASTTSFLSRGKLLVAKAGCSAVSEVSSTTTDVLELARRWGIKLIFVKEFTDYIRREIARQKVNESLDNNNLESTVYCHLEGPFIKTQDNKTKFKPSYKVFHRWPELNTESPSDVCPFIPFDQLKRASKPLAQQKPLQGVIVTEKHKNVDKDKEFTGAKTLGRKKNAPAKRKSPLYCEICNVDYESLNSHILTRKHETYFENEENLKDLIGVINSLPKYKDVEYNDLSFDDNIDEVDPSPPLNSPSTSSTFTLNGGVIKSLNLYKSTQKYSGKALNGGGGTFLPLHHVMSTTLSQSSISPTPQLEQNCSPQQQKLHLNTGLENRRYDETTDNDSCADIILCSDSRGTPPPRVGLLLGNLEPSSENTDIINPTIYMSEEY